MSPDSHDGMHDRRIQFSQSQTTGNQNGYLTTFRSRLAELVKAATYYGTNEQAIQGMAFNSIKTSVLYYLNLKRLESARECAWIDVQLQP
jgi:hypothetical protein